jgi:predicted nucleic acid-binding protein
MLVIDASVTLSWGLPDERSKEGDLILNRVIDEGATVPSIWTLEVVNALAVAERRKRITPDQAQETLTLLKSLPIRLSPSSINSDFGPVMSLTRSHGLSAYDAAYLELAARERIFLATFDQPLRRAARAFGVSVLAA